MIDPLILDAIAWKETASGLNNCPRFEASYLPKGDHFTVQGYRVIGQGGNFNDLVQQRWKRWGLASAASYGPWQILYHTAADRGYDGAPWALWDPVVSRQWAIAQLHYLRDRWNKKLVADLFEAWNAGPGGTAPGYRDVVTAQYRRKGGVEP